MVHNDVNDDEKSNASGSDVENSSGASPGNHGSTATGDSRSDTAGRTSSNEAARNDELARRETRHVNRLRYFVLASLLVAAVGVAFLVYWISTDAVHEEMHALFFADCLRFDEVFEDIRSERIATLASLAVTAIAHAVDQKHDWPFVTLSSYQERAYTAREHSGALQVIIAPIVTQENRANWEKYVVSNDTNVAWMDDSIVYQGEVGSQAFVKDYGKSFQGNKTTQSYSIQRRDPLSGKTIPVHFDARDRYLPSWEMSPFLTFDDVNVDLLQDDDSRSFYAQMCLNHGAIVIGDLQYHTPGGINSPNWTTSAYAQLLSIEKGEEVEYLGDPTSYVFIPIFDSFKQNRVPTAVLIGLFNWGNFFKDVLPEGTNGVDLVLRNTCSESFTYRVNGEDVIPLGIGDLHDRDFDHFEYNASRLESGMIADGTRNGLGFVDRECYYTLSIYPTQVFAEDFETATPWILVGAVAGVMLFAIGMFFVYDYLVERRQTLVLRKAIQSTAIVSSLFPKNVGDRLMKASGNPPGDDGEARAITVFRDLLRKKKASALPSMEKGVMAKQESVGEDDTEETIADLFPSCTVLFSDIAGFTAWSSTREPSQVFILLQNLYQAFDKIAIRRKVFKVETIGDSYLAVTGLPEPQDEHAIIMAKFARDCMQKMHQVTSALEVRLGPDTGDLSMRFGLNSGQVTGGVLRGDRARFQLFGDTVNTAARMESTGERGRIQISKSTADLLIAAGKKHWLRPREEPVTAKGKGIMHTFWLEIDGARADLNNSDKDLLAADDNAANASPRRSQMMNSLNGGNVAVQQESRRIDWLTEVLLDYVKQIVAQNKKASRALSSRGVAYRYNPGSICLDEVVESFDFPRENGLDHHHQHATVELPPTVPQELHAYVTEISSLYHDRNQFHNFDHACHVTMSVHKLMKRVDSSRVGGSRSSDNLLELVVTSDGSQNHNGIHMTTPDPLTLFAIVFASLIHDIDHPGVTNAQLGMEQPDLSKHYRGKSIAEQSSFDIGWDLLMSESYDNLRRAIFPTESELKRFRQVVVNCVLATDIFDKEMGDRRKSRWDRVFGSSSNVLTDPDIANTRATIVLEYIIQASDVSHTMQHWHVYTKWNRRLFEEMRIAFTQGRMVKDPAAFWYEGELGFFDNYVIPLAKKLQECRVFGVSSDECLNYALSNRNEWEAKGKSIVKDMISTMEEIDEKHGPNVSCRPE